MENNHTLSQSSHVSVMAYGSLLFYVAPSTLHRRNLKTQQTLHILDLCLAIPIKCFVSHRPPSREGGLVGRAKKERNEHMKVVRASEGRTAKYESLVTWSFRS